jgi:hypothetical protein
MSTECVNLIKLFLLQVIVRRQGLSSASDTSSIATIFEQIAVQVASMDTADLRLPARSWKV